MEIAPRNVLITIEASSTDILEDIPPFIRYAIEREDNGSTVIKQVEIREL